MLWARLLTIFATLPAMAAVADGAEGAMPPLAGVCNGAAGVGVGCGFDASRMTAFGLTIAPKKAVLRMPWCAEHCYATCPPQQPVPEDCEDCVFVVQNTTTTRCFRQPYNVAATAMPTQGGCYETVLADTTDSYIRKSKHTTSHSSGFIFTHSHSKKVHTTALRRAPRAPPRHATPRPATPHHATPIARSTPRHATPRHTATPRHANQVIKYYEMQFERNYSMAREAGRGTRERICVLLSPSETEAPRTAAVPAMCPGPFLQIRHLARRDTRTNQHAPRAVS